MLSSVYMATSLLLADDSPTIAKILGMALQSEDYAIRSVLTAEEAIAELKKDPPFFFLVDLTLPEKDGFYFADFIRNDPKLAHIKIVFLASAFDPVDKAAVSASGADLLINKPFDPAELRQKLRSVRDAPPKFPSGAKVQGSLSGFTVKPEKTLSSISAPPAEPSDAEIGDLILGSGSESDANSILEGLIGESSAPAESALDILQGAQEVPFSPGSPVSDSVSSDATAMIDFSNVPPADKNSGPILDLSATFAAPPTDPSREIPPVFRQSGKPSSPVDPNLSKNAQALAAFFEAEIDAHAPPPKPDVPTIDLSAETEAFDSSAASIEWGASPAIDSSLNAWSAEPVRADTPPPAPTRAPVSQPLATPPKSQKPVAGPLDDRPPPFASRDRHQGAAESNGSFLFDTGGSNFRFAEDYVSRISKGFTGAPDETHPVSEPVFHQSSSDSSRLSPSAPTLGGAWGAADAQRMEQIIREEVQMAVREVVEKVAWEVIPELAENLIKQELEKVLKQMET